MRKMEESFKNILEKYGITIDHFNDTFFNYKGRWILDYYGMYTDSDTSKTFNCFALMTKVIVENNEVKFGGLEKLRLDYTPEELEERLKYLIQEFKKAQYELKFNEIKQDFS